MDKIYHIRRLRNEMRLAARASGNKENIRRAAHMKLLASSAQTIPMWVGRDGEEPPELCGSIPADQSYVAEQVRSVRCTVLYTVQYTVNNLCSSPYTSMEIN